MMYRIHVWCPRCDKTEDVFAPIIPNPRILCSHCFRKGFNLHEEMKIVAAEQVREPSDVR